MTTTTELVRFDRLERGWVRRGEDGHPVHVLDDADRSPVHHTYPRGYDSDCGYCYLNATHSVRRHVRSVNEHRRLMAPASPDRAIAR